MHLPGRTGAVVVVLVSLTTACGPAAHTAEQARPDPTRQQWYGETLGQVSQLTAEAEQLFRTRHPDEAARVILRAQPLATRLISVPRPSLEATEAASDLDTLYARMLVANKHYGWARLLYQKNVARWRSWNPKTPETEKRKKMAEEALAECDRHLAE